MKSAAPANEPPPPPRAPATATEDEGTGLPGLRSWRAVYFFVFGCFVIYVVLLTVFSRSFS